MRSKSIKKSLAASAVLASSIAATAALAPGAQATSPGASNSPLTVGQGAWAPDGSRYVYIDHEGQVLTNTPGGTPTVVDPAKAGVTRSNPTFFNHGSAIVFSETVNGGPARLMAIPSYTPAGDAVPETTPLTPPGPTSLEGNTAPESNGKGLVFQHLNLKTHQQDIYVEDSFGRGGTGPIVMVANGTEPSIAPDGKSIAFVRADAAKHEQIWTVTLNGSYGDLKPGTVKQLTSDARDHTSPTYSPDGTRIAFEAGSGASRDVESIAASGGGQRVESKQAGAPSYRPLVKDTEVRLAGADRLGTAIAASQDQWAAGQAYSVVLSRSDDFADALGGSALATSEGGPLLLTPTDGLDAGVKAEITRALGTTSADHQKTVFVLGGEKALSASVFNAVKALGYHVQRIAGADRFATSVAIAKQTTHYFQENGWGQPGQVLVATGDLAPDALSAGAAAESGAVYGPVQGVVVLTDGNKMPAATRTYLEQVEAHSQKNYPTPVYGVGGPADKALTSIGIKHTGLVGSDRYQTSYLVAKTFFGDWKNGADPSAVGFATGLTWPDALSGGAFMGHEQGPLLLVDPQAGLSPQEKQYLRNWAPDTDHAYVFGGTQAVSDAVQDGIGTDISGPAGYGFELNPKQ